MIKSLFLIQDFWQGKGCRQAIRILPGKLISSNEMNCQSSMTVPLWNVYTAMTLWNLVLTTWKTILLSTAKRSHLNREEMRSAM